VAGSSRDPESGVPAEQQAWALSNPGIPINNITNKDNRISLITGLSFLLKHIGKQSFILFAELQI